MGNFLGKKGEPASRKGGGEILDRDRAVLDLKVSRDKCKKYQVKLEAEADKLKAKAAALLRHCLLYTSPSPRDLSTSRMPSSA